MTLYAHVMREVAESAGLPTLRQIAARPGVKAAYRVTMHYGDYHAADAVTTVVMRTAQVNAVVETVYLGRFAHTPIRRGMPPAGYAGFTAELRAVGFDKLRDHDGLSPYGVDLVMVERAAGTFHKDVIFAPGRAEGDYARMLAAVRLYLPEALREVR